MQKLKKIYSAEEILLFKDEFVLCYGHFNLIHPGHIRYLNYAKSLKNKLIVAIKSDKDLEDGNYRNYYNEDERSNGLASINVVDGIIVLRDISLSSFIENTKPSMIVLGEEFKKINSEIIVKAKKSAEKVNSEIVFHSGTTNYSANELFQDSTNAIEDDKHRLFRRITDKYNISFKDIEKTISQFKNQRMLVIGDSIIDNYVSSDPLGMSSEAPIIVVKENGNNEFAGGAAVVASHIAELGAKCIFISVTGDDLQRKFLKKTLRSRGVESHLIIDSSRPTSYKTRYLVGSQKIFRVSKLEDHQISPDLEERIIEMIREFSSDIDGILISDFVYGVITPKIIAEVRRLSRKHEFPIFADLQCSSQIGDISKFKGFDLLTPTEKEARLAVSDSKGGIEWIANKLISITDSKNTLIKLGADGFIAYGNINENIRQNFPALSANPVDVSGAGDSLFASMSLAISTGSGIMEASIIGSVVASLAVNQLGNVPVKYDSLSQRIKTIFNEA